MLKSDMLYGVIARLSGVRRKPVPLIKRGGRRKGVRNIITPDGLLSYARKLDGHGKAEMPEGAWDKGSSS